MHTLIIDDEPLARAELRYLLKDCEEICTIEEAESIEEALQKMLFKKPNLLFLDIHLTGESGLDLAKTLKEMPDPPLIVFATAYDEHALTAFNLNAIDYVLKPFEASRIHQAVSKAAKIKQAQETTNTVEATAKGPATLPIQVDERIFILPFSEITAIATENGVTTVYTQHQHYPTNESLTFYEKKLPQQDFLRVHRSFLVNLHQIHEVQPWFNQTYQLTMSNQLKVPVSRSYLKTFRQRMGI